LPPPRALLHSAGRALRRSVPTLVTLACVAVVSVGLWLGYGWLTTSPRFAVAAVHVSGHAHLSDDDVRQLAGVAVGDNIFRVDVDVVERRIEAAPWIAHARVKRRLPDELHITVAERRPIALVDLAGLYLAEADGAIFKRAAIDRGEGAELPILTGIERAAYLREPALAQASIRAALSTLAVYAEHTGRPAVGEVHVDPRRGTTLRTRDTGLAIRLGDATGNDLAARLRVFDAVWQALDEAERRAASAIRVDNETHTDRVTVAFRAHDLQPRRSP
jgi:cell division protein FtsQ